ncbi:MAG TPA: endonuclease/exonuclease/phosphatase family protein [Actinomycetota bacterium]|nr:endonuclease/exonuclease/phosphatase family protein [Actinomycetota bacterium]
MQEVVGISARARLVAGFACLVSVIVLFPITSPASAAPLEETSPVSELVVVAVNARQNTPDGSRLTELVNALRGRPVGADGRFFSPDVIALNETPPGTLATLRDQLNSVFALPTHYEIAGTGSDDSVKGKFLVNTGGVAVIGSQTWTDVCDPTIRYQLVNVSDKGSDATLSVGGVHFRKNYTEDGGPLTCREKNAREARAQLATQGTDGSALGDFNRRPVDVERECDPDETSASLPWYAQMTEFSTIDGRSYIDTVRQYHRANGLSMKDQWTQEWDSPSTLCDGSTGHRRNRIDYIFVSDEVATIEARVDAPGWADPVVPGAIGCSPAPACKYSDHRFVWARIALPAATPPAARPATPVGLTALASGPDVVDLQWQDVTDETAYAIERSSDGTTWSKLGTTVADTVVYADRSVIENKTYHYRVSATNAGGSSVPSAPATATTPGAAPSGITDLRGSSPSKTKVVLNWSAATDTGGSGLAGYEVWRAISEFGTYTKVATTTTPSYSATKQPRRATYWYYVIAYDRAGNRSVPSNKVTVTVSG